MTAPPGNLAERPAHDLLSELLRSVRLSGEQIIAYAPPRVCPVGFAGLGCLHIVEEGDLALRLDGEGDGDGDGNENEKAEHVEYLGPGDVVLLPRGDPHRLGAAAHDSAGPSRWLCGTFTIGDPQASHLLGSLPAVIVLRGERGPALEGLDVACRMLVTEMQAPSQGSAVMIARILDLIFIQILRAWAAGAQAEPNWLAGAFDPQISPALSAIHREPGRDWAVEDLARECHLSRSSFAARFAERVGQPPATYLAHVRLDAATGLLRESTLPVALIAQRVGYTSEAAFSRAFKSRYGEPPARWRRAGQPPGLRR